jgi:RND family efflux transporter MFP subunit
MWIVRLALRRPYSVVVLAVLVLMFGALVTLRMKKDIFPAIDIPVVMVVWNYPGLSAEDIERRVVAITERAFSTTVNGISRLESQSIVGIGLIKVYFEQGTDMGESIAQITSVSNTVTRQMPPGMTPPNIVSFNASNVPVAQLTLTSQTLTEQQIFDHAANFIRIRLFTIPGLATPAPYGGKQREVMIDLDPDAVAARRLSPEDVVNAILASNIITPAGTLRSGSTEYDVVLNNSPKAIDDMAKFPLALSDGAVVRLGDVAHVHDGFAVQQNIVRVDGKRASYLSILKKAGASTLAVVDAAKDAIPSIRAAAPGGLEIRMDFDQSVFVRAAIGGVIREGVIAAVLVSLMVLVFLGSWRSVVIVSTSIPLSIAVGLIGLYGFGQTINVMTLGGLALAIGMLVDDATVEIENINRNRHLDEAKSITAAILDAASQIAIPALAATSTICVVFFPVVLLTGPSRYLFSALALSVVISMVASYLFSRTLVPALAEHRWLLFVVGIAAVVLVGGFLLVLHLRRAHADSDERAARTREAQKGPRVAVVEAKPAPSTRKLTLPGEVRPFRQATVYARVSGYLAALYVDRGDKVKANQVLGRVTTPETELQLGPLLASYASKKAVADRLRPLVPNGVVANIDLEKADADAQAAKSEVDRLGALTRFNDIRAPFDGIITQRYVDIGALMPAPTAATQSAQPLVDVADTSKVRIVCYVGQHDATGVHVGAALSITRDDDPMHPIAAKVTQIPNDLDPRTRTMWVESDVDNPAGVFYPGLFVTMRLDVPAPAGVLIPSDAISLDKGEPVVAVIEGDKARYQVVEVADDDGRTARIIKGVKAGDKLANRISDEITDGGRVQPVTPRQQGSEPNKAKASGSNTANPAAKQGSGSDQGGGEGSSAAETSGRRTGST